MARGYAFYFTIALLVMSVYLDESIKVKVDAARDVSRTITELKSKLNGYNLMGGCGGYCRQSSDCYVRSCPRCLYDVLAHTYGCHS
ncbi:hypothetical protein EJD97_022360 [Solanum chilense]|uniref:Carboxypeptidase A inhibitor-like domain-containing protein n=1 Tax=Solanum chilense TaxID=4083 RepID=A0A6N2AVZ3_SOLCI|nr:hypothetical protein EJD97_022360 [Solanum chilense]